MSRLIWGLVGLAVLCTAAGAQEKPPQWITEGPYVESRSFAIELPLEILATKLFVEVEIGGKARRFVFDTGSPSMMNAALAAELGLKAVDKRKGQDAHGAIVESEIVQADMTLGGVTFRKVPMSSADLSASKAGQCLIGDRVLGSEVLPLCAWQIDLPESVLRCNTRLKSLHHVKGATKQHLYNFGYPHAPILDVRFAEKAVSKAMLDTGSPGYLTIMRESPPSLIGASILEHFVVTLDARSESAYFDSYRKGPFARPSFGFSLAFDDEISVALVWDESPAAKAGLRGGHHLTRINGVATEISCDGIERALRAMSGETVELEWEGGAATLTRGIQILPPGRSTTAELTSSRGK